MQPVVPWLWYYEIASASLIQVHRKRVDFEKVVVYLSIIGEMTIDVDPPDAGAILRLPHLARAHGLTCYDAAFLELAKRRQLPLATADKALIRAALDFEVPILNVNPPSSDGSSKPTVET